MGCPLLPSLVLFLMIAVGGCAPPPELTAPQEDLVRRCLELQFKQETSPECREVTKPMQKAYLEKHPHFYDELIAERQKFVEEQIAEDQRRRDELIVCLDDREAGAEDSAPCAKFKPHEIARGLDDRRRRRCAQATLDGKASAQRYCEGLTAMDLEDEVKAERVRRASRP